jgi:hypothetical protein
MLFFIMNYFNDYQEYFLGTGGKGGRCVGLKTVSPSCADCLEIWVPQPPGTLRAFQACVGIDVRTKGYIS